MSSLIKITITTSLLYLQTRLYESNHIVLKMVFTVRRGMVEIRDTIKKEVVRILT